MRFSELHTPPLPLGRLAEIAAIVRGLGGRSEADQELSLRREVKERGLPHSAVTDVLPYIRKADVSAIGTANAPAMMTAPEIDFASYSDGFSATLSRMPSIQRVPAKTRTLLAASGTTAEFVPEGVPLPVGRIDFDAIGQMLPARVGGISVVTTELARFAAPNGEQTVLRDLASATARAIDLNVWSPSNTGSGAAPASISSSGVLIPSTGTTAAQTAADVHNALAQIRARDPRALVAVAQQHNAARLVTMTGSGGTQTFPGSTLGASASFLGMPLLILADDDNSPAESFISFCDSSELLLADSGAELDVSRETALQADSSPQTGAQQMTSLWTQNLIALRGVRFVTWKLRRASACVTIV